MKLEILSVLDLKAKTYGRPIADVTLGSARRGFGDACVSPDGQFYKHPEDFVLMHLGEFDDQTGEIKTKAPEPIAKALDYVNK